MKYLKSFWTYVILYLTTVGLYVAKCEINPEYTFSHEGPVVLSSELGHLSVEFNITQVETGLNYASACVKHIKQVTTAHKANVSIYQELLLLQSIAEAEIQEIYESYKHLMEFFTDLNPKELHNKNISTVSSSSGGGTQIIDNKVESFTSNISPISPVRNKRQLGIFLGLAGLIGGATLYGFLQTEKVSEIEDNLQTTMI